MAKKKKGEGCEFGCFIPIVAIVLITSSIATFFEKYTLLAWFLTVILIEVLGIIVIQVIKRKKRYNTMYNSVKDFLNEIDQMSGQKFEEVIIKLILPANGFTNIQGTAYTGDYGVDVVAYKEGIKYAIQCKRFDSTVSNKAIQEVVAGRNHYGCSGAIVITNNRFTKNAIQLANENNVILYDRNELIKMLGNIKNIQNKNKE